MHGRDGALAAAMLLAAAGVSACRRRPPTTHHVVIENFVTAPATVVAAVGDTIEWVNRDIVPHTATAIDSTWDSGSIDAGASWRTVVRKPGVHDYVCRFHPAMRARVEVR